MKTCIVSSSLNPDSTSFVLAKLVEWHLNKQDGVEVIFVDLRDYELRPALKEKTPELEELTNLVRDADNYIFATPVYNYTVSDTLKMFLDSNCFPGKEKKHVFFGLISSGGGLRSFLAPQDLFKILMNEYHMIPFPTVLFATEGDFTDGKLMDEGIAERAVKYAKDFAMLGGKLLA
jgi:FMN reductase